MNSRGEMEARVEGVSSSLFSPIIIDNFGSSDEDKIDKNLWPVREIFLKVLMNALHPCSMLITQTDFPNKDFWY